MPPPCCGHNFFHAFRCKCVTYFHFISHIKCTTFHSDSRSLKKPKYEGEQYVLCFKTSFSTLIFYGILCTLPFKVAQYEKSLLALFCKIHVCYNHISMACLDFPFQFCDASLVKHISPILCRYAIFICQILIQFQ